MSFASFWKEQELPFMVGKPNISKAESSGAAMSPSSLQNPLDQERAASMADEGGAAGAEMEAEDPSGTGRVQSTLSSGHRRGLLWLGAGAALGLGAYALYSAYRERSEPALQPE